MNLSIITEYPSWFILLCLAAGFIYAFLLYRRDHLLGEMSPVLKKGLSVFRFLTVSILCFLLLGPMLRTISREIEKPIVILAVDNSQSVIASKDSTARRNAIAASMEKLNNALKGDYDLRAMTFGDQVKEGVTLNYNDKLTDFTTLYDELNIQFLNRNVGAIIIASDGLYNSGNSPVTGPSRIKAPVYTIALGDTNEYRDLILSRVNHNKTAYLGNSFPLEIMIDARQASGSNVNLTVKEDSAVLFTRTVNIAGNRFHASVPVYIEAKSRGIKHYRISLSSITGEATLTNNSRDVFVNVVESKQKILLIANAPHPDIAALKSAIENSPNYELKVVNAKEFNGNATGYNLVILHQLPSGTNNISEWLARWEKEGVSLFYILGSSTAISAINAVNTGLQVTGNNGSLNEVQAVVAADFSLFTISDEFKNMVPKWPPLSSPFGVYKLNANASSLLNQRVGNVITGQPFFFFRNDNNRKIAMLVGEGLWKWKLAEFEEKGNSNIYDELINRTVQYLAAEQNRTPFRIQTRNSFMENEAVIFDAELINESGALVNTPEVRMTISSASNKQYTFTFSRTDNAYVLDAGLFPVGNYRFKAETKLGDKLYAQSGEFSVGALQLETTNTVADHQLLFATASRNGGIMIYPGQEDVLTDALKKRDDITSVSYQHKKLKDLIDSPWILVLLIALLGTEWFIRKRSGGY